MATTATEKKAAAKTVEKGAEKVVDGLEDIVDAAPAAAQTINRGVLLVGGVLIGTSIGFLVAKKILEKKYTKLAEEEIQAVRDIYYEKAVKLQQAHGSTRVVSEKKSVEEILEERGYTPPTAEDQRYTDAEQAAIDEANAAAARAEEAAERAEEIAETEVIVTNVFHAGEIDEWDWDVEKTIREEGHNEVPYVLHRDEYFANENGWEQMNLTFFEGDDVLADMHDTPVDDQDAMVGLGNLSKFGHGSGDPNTVYVRNPELQLEIEIIHSDGKFSEQRRGIPVDPPRREDGRFAPRNQQSPPSGDPRKRRNRGG